MKPTPRLIWTLLGAAVLAVFFPDSTWWLGVMVLAMVVVGFDWWWGGQAGAVTCERTVSPVLPVSKQRPVDLTLHNANHRALAVAVLDQAPESFVGPTSAEHLVLPAGGAATYQYFIRPVIRGDAHFGKTILTVRSPMGFWDVIRAAGEEESVKVYPDFDGITQYLHLLADQQSQRLGLRRAQRRGEGLEFHQLRDFRQGDSMRQVDWKATARKRTLISREYTEERDQSVIFLLDTGGRMRASDGDLSHFDHALNALLLLSYVALRQGDRVGLQAFGPSNRWVSGLRGVSAVNELLRSLYDLQAQSGASDYLTAAQDVLERHRRRALVIVLTNLRDDDLDLVPAVQLLRKRHAVLVASLRESALTEVLGSAPTDFDETLTHLGARSYVRTRDELKAKVSTLTQLIIDCSPAELPMQLVNGYWTFKRAGVL